MDDDVTFEELCDGYEAQDQAEFAEFMAEPDPGNVDQSS